jgi:hypothetical protein
MYGYLRHSSSRPRWRILTGALLLAFLLRAMIAVGYMPAAGSATDDRLGMSLCVHGLSVGALKVLALEDSPLTAQPLALDCAFGAVVAQAALPLLPGVFIAAVQDDTYLAVWRAAAPAFAQAWHGPPSGARGPPLAAL